MIKKSKLIVGIDRQTAKLCLSLVDLCGRAVYTWHCGKGCGDQLTSYIIVERVGCEAPKPAEPYRGCAWCDECADNGAPASQAPASQAIKYPAFDVDADGSTCYFLDDKLLTAETGRYDATLYVCDLPVATFQIELRDRVRLREIRQVRARHAPACA